MALWANVNTLNVFADESGSVNLNDPNPYYWAVAIIMPDSVLSANIVSLDNIASRFFSGGIIKSSNVGNNHKRRLEILQEIVSLDFQFAFLLVNKKKLDPESGYRFKPSFYKNINRRLYESLRRCEGKTLSLICKVDQHGTTEFQKQVEKYMKAHEDLLCRFSMTFVDDKSHRCVQLADFIAGTLRFCWKPEKENEYTAQIKKLLQSHQLTYSIFPPNKKQLSSIDADSTPEEIDEEIGNVLYNQAVEFIEEYEPDDDEYKQMQVATLKILLERADVNKNDHIYLAEIQEQLEEMGFEKINRQLFISKIIGGLRFAGIIISGSNKGYRLALSRTAIEDYLDHNTKIIFPMLSRLRKARERVSSFINYDILFRDKDQNLKGILNTLQEVDIAETISFDEEKAIINNESSEGNR